MRALRFSGERRKIVTLKPQHRKGINCYVCRRGGVSKEAIAGIIKLSLDEHGNQAGVLKTYYCAEHVPPQGESMKYTVKVEATDDSILVRVCGDNNGNFREQEHLFESPGVMTGADLVAVLDSLNIPCEYHYMAGREQKQEQEAGNGEQGEEKE
jgi:hypothetical protein